MESSALCWGNATTGFRLPRSCPQWVFSPKATATTARCKHCTKTAEVTAGTAARFKLAHPQHRMAVNVASWATVKPQKTLGCLTACCGSRQAVMPSAPRRTPGPATDLHFESLWPRHTNEAGGMTRSLGRALSVRCYTLLPPSSGLCMLLALPLAFNKTLCLLFGSFLSFSLYSAHSSEMLFKIKLSLSVQKCSKAFCLLVCFNKMYGHR